MSKNLRDQLLSEKPEIKEIKLKGKSYFIRNLSVGETNAIILDQRKRQIKIAQQLGVELNLEDEEILTEQLQKVYDPYAIARGMATRLCNENGELLFDTENEEDLKLLSSLDEQVFEDYSKAIGEHKAKNSQSAEDSN